MSPGTAAEIENVTVLNPRQRQCLLDLFGARAKPASDDNTLAGVGRYSAAIRWDRLIEYGVECPAIR